jgi:lactate dehydrogenase-like 2-hydroxyacid dehydrogenase
MKFKRIVSIDNTGLIDSVKERLKELADEVIFYDDFPTSNKEIISRIGDADCVLTSWNTRIGREVIENCNNLKYIGMCCSLIDEKSANVDISAAKEHGITVFGVRDYGDEGVIEFIISELIRLLHGYGDYQWKEEVMELTNQKLGIIGMGAVGSMLAERALSFGMKVCYYNRSRKPELEAKGVLYMELEDLLSEVDILSTNLPRNTIVLHKRHFDLFGNHKIFINTTLGPTFEIPAFTEWLAQDGNYAIFDKEAMGVNFEEFKEYQKLVYSNKTAGWTAQAKERLSYKVLENINKYFSLAK